jgi:hypothetical protein
MKRLNNEINEEVRVVEILIALAILAGLGLAATAFGADSRDANDWISHDAA